MRFAAVVVDDGFVLIVPSIVLGVVLKAVLGELSMLQNFFWSFFDVDVCDLYVTYISSDSW